MDNNIQHGFLLKFGQKEHLENLLNGQLYLKSIRHFKENCEDKIGRYDKNENLTDVWRQPYFKGKLLFDNIEIAKSLLSLTTENIFAMTKIVKL